MRFHERTNTLKYEATLRHVTKGTALYEEGKYSEAIYSFTKAISLEPDTADFYRRRGLAYSELMLLDDAIADFTKSMELESDNPLHFLNRALAYIKYGKHELAIDDLTWNISMAQASNEDPKIFSDLYNFRAECYYALNLFEKAAEDATIGLAFTPDNNDLLNIRCIANKRLKKTDNVINDLLLINKNNPDDDAVYLNLAQEYICKGQIDLAKECIDKFFISDDAYGYAYSIRAYIQQFRGTPDDVRNDFLKAIELGDENASAMLEEYEQLLFKKEKN
ncbi:MAG: hypothetical protein COW85_12375 [Ignavibacteria bacterium CG22_combo_CG10-13_8_21_14_all_37_15]|nr:MAG: hypothetical protein COW85_12375 [Ignavibacteria bacterium CG22_combo_CG10-13_8_21_14_all_37_15]